ncbi:MAG TPA: class I SAM-dependent methyltransferase [Bacteroidia bacterium]|nr:class I SAM-dependent methyltransferase [Bacteroidia bacterium]
MKTTERFSDRVANYVKYRPGYPPAMLERLFSEGILKKGNVVADVGSGTGLSAKVFLDAGCEVFGIEPNKEMREAGEEFLKNLPAFHSIDATAEQTSLKENSIDIVVAGQAFHWFDQEKTRSEFKRILKKDGTVLLIWNDRRTDSSDFLKAYEDLLKMFGTDYEKVNHRNVNLNEEVFDHFFGKNNWKTFSTENIQEFNFEGLKGRLFSSSYVPAEDHPDSKLMVDVLKKIFLRYQENGVVKVEYDTRVYYGGVSHVGC